MLATTSLAILAILGGSTLVSAHGHVQAWTVNGQRRAGFNPSWPPQYGPTASRPTDNSDQGFADYNAGVVACGGNSAGNGLQTWDLDAGSTVTAHWNTWPDSHKGSVTEYMARCPDSGCDGVPAASLDWIKIQEDSYDGSRWPTDTIVSSLNWSFRIPTYLAPGNYLVRHDLLAMHSPGAPQVYPVCFQARLRSSGSVVPSQSQTVRFPAAYNINPGFKTWNLYSGNQNGFVPPGPAVFNPGNVPEPSVETTTSPSSTTLSTTTTTSSTTTTTSSTTTAPSTTTTTTSPSPTTSPSSTTTTTTSPGPSTTTTPAPAPTGRQEMGGPAPEVTQRDGRWWTNNGSYHDQPSAIQASCMWQMNKCKDWANSLPNAIVQPAFKLCDHQQALCSSSTSACRRDFVSARHAKRSFWFF